MRLCILFAVSIFTWIPPALSTENHCIIMLHGLGRSANSLWIAEHFFTARDYEVHRLAYPFTKEDLGQLGEQIRSEVQGLCPTTPNFLTHLMGGIILRVIKSTHPDFAVARVVMLGPPNHGSEIVDEWGDWKLFVQLNGPAGARLGRDGIVTELPNVEFDLGIIAGSRSLNPYYSHLITGPDDGKVSIEATKSCGNARSHRFTCHAYIHDEQWRGFKPSLAFFLKWVFSKGMKPHADVCQLFVIGSDRCNSLFQM
jgi:triacylglycerol lipase